MEPHLPYQSYAKLDELSENFHSLLDSGNLADVSLLVAGKELRAHKLILATRSPVFAAMFEHDTKEKKESRIEITEFSFDVCQHMLRFIYTGRVYELDRYAMDLMTAADMVGCPFSLYCF